VVFTHEAVREWETKLAPALSETLRKQRRGKVGRSWYCDETYLKVKGRGVYLSAHYGQQAAVQTRAAG
jgi:putative transposase